VLQLEAEIADHILADVLEVEPNQPGQHVSPVPRPGKLLSLGVPGGGDVGREPANHSVVDRSPRCSRTLWNLGGRTGRSIARPAALGHHGDTSGNGGRGDPPELCLAQRARSAVDSGGKPRASPRTIAGLPPEVAY